MQLPPRVWAVLVLLLFAGNVTSVPNHGNIRQSRLPRAPSIPEQGNFMTIPSSRKYASHSSSVRGTLLIHAQGQPACIAAHRILGRLVRFVPQSQLIGLTLEAGAKGLYRFSKYDEPRLQLLPFSWFMFACLNDLFEAIANHHFSAHDA